MGSLPTRLRPFGCGKKPSSAKFEKETTEQYSVEGIGKGCKAISAARTIIRAGERPPSTQRRPLSLKADLTLLLFLAALEQGLNLWVGQSLQLSSPIMSLVTIRDLHSEPIISRRHRKKRPEQQPFGYGF